MVNNSRFKYFLNPAFSVIRLMHQFWTTFGAENLHYEVTLDTGKAETFNTY